MYIILTQCFASRLGGIESLVSNLSLSIGKKSEVVVFADQHNFLRDMEFDKKHQNRILVKRFGGIKYFRRRKKIKELKLFLELKKIECVIADTWKSLELCIDYLNEKNIPVLCLAHGNELLSNKSIKKKRIISIFNKVDVIVTNSNFTANLIKKNVGDYNNIKVINPGAEDLRFLKPDAFISIKGEPILLTLSRLEKRKGHALVLQAVKRLKEKFPKIKYFIVGDGDQKPELERIVKKYDLIENVHFTGTLNEHQKKYLLDQVSLMIMPTLDESHNFSIEGFGISYIEAAFFGIPSIASNVGGTSEAVLHDNTGIIIDNNNQLFETVNNLLLNRIKLTKLGENAKKRAEQLFKWDIVVNNYLSVLK